MKKTLSLLLCLLMLLGSLGTAALADDSLYYVVPASRLIQDYDGETPAELTIPATIQDAEIAVIGDYIFTQNAALETLVISEGIVTIAYKNFNDAPLLTSVTLPETLQAIRDNTLCRNESLAELTFPPRVTFIGDSLIYNLGLKTVKFTGMAPMYVGPSAFMSMPELVIYVPDDQLEAYTAVLPEGLNIQPSGENAIVYDFTAPEADFVFDAGVVTDYVGFDARVDIPQTIGGEYVTTLGAGAFDMNHVFCISVPEGVTTIEDNAFKSLTYLECLKLPASLTSVGAEAFVQCVSLKKIIIPANADTAIVDALAAATGATIEFCEEAAPVEIPAAPAEASEAPASDGDAVVWVAVGAEGEGMVLDKAALEAMGMNITFTLNADGTGVLDMEDDAGEIAWTEADGAVTISVEGDSLTLTPDENGRLAGDFGGIIIFFAQEGSEAAAAAPTAASAELIGGAAEDFIGTWNCAMMHIEGVQVDPAAIGLHMTLVVNEDGTCTLVDDEGPAEAAWTQTAEGGIEIDGMVLMLNTEGQLVMMEQGSEMYFERGEAMEMPAVEPTEVDTSALIGTWFDGDAVNFTINEDGTCVAVDQYGESQMEWEVVEGVPMITTGMWYDAPLVLNEDGTLYVNDGFFVDKTFTFGEGEIRVGSTLEAPTGTIAADSADAFVGAWIGETMVMESGTFALADMMMTMDLTINADGTMSMYNGYENEESAWTFDGGVLTAEDGLITISLMEDGKLCMAEEFSILYLTPAEGGDEPADESTDEVVPVAAEMDDFVGMWTGTTMEYDGETYALSDLGITMDLSLYADGVITLFDGETLETGAWTMVDGKADIDGMIMTLMSDGTVVAEDPDGQKVMFAYVQMLDGPDSIATPSGEDIIGVWVDEYRKLELYADGTGVFTMPDGSTEDRTWEATETGCAFTDFWWSDYTAVLEADGSLTVSDGSYTTYNMVREGAAPVEEPAAEVDVTPILGEWTNGSDKDLLFTEDGKCMVNGELEWNWAVENGEIKMTWGNYAGETVMVDAEGVLQIGEGRPFYRPDAEVPSGAPASVAGNAEDFVGFWQVSTMEMEGMVMDMAEMGMIMDLTVNADGTFAMYDGESTDEGEWTLADGKMDVMGIDVMGIMQFGLVEDGRLYMEGEGSYMYFVRGEATETPVETPADPLAGGEIYLGEWNEEDNSNKLYIREDGTMALVYPDDYTCDMTWVITDGQLEVVSGIWEGYFITVNASDVLEIGMFDYYRAEEEPAGAEGDAVYAEAEDFVGLWIGKSMEMDGQTYALSDVGTVMEIKLDANGNISLFDGETTETGAWTMVDGKADIDGMFLTLMSDGTVVAEDPDGAKVVFTGFVGEWKACYMATGALNGDLRSMGITSTLILNADGTGSIDFPTPEAGEWYREEGIVRFGENGMPMELLTGGFLKFGSDMGGYMVFSQDESAVWDPEAAVAPAAPAATEAPTAAEAPASDVQALLNRKFVAKTYTDNATGQTMDASIMGEYSLLFRENGTCDFGLAGTIIQNLNWGLQKVAIGLEEYDAFVVNYGGSLLNAVITEEGFDMNFYGAIILHFVPAE